jgi:hypothetical protein
MARLEQRVESARSHLDVLLTELDRRRHAVVRMERRLQDSWPLIGAGLAAALALAVGTFAFVRYRQHHH